MLNNTIIVFTVRHQIIITSLILLVQIHLMLGWLWILRLTMVDRLQQEMVLEPVTGIFHQLRILLRCCCVSRTAMSILGQCAVENIQFGKVVSV